jgi:hypothetical protein
MEEIPEIPKIPTLLSLALELANIGFEKSFIDFPAASKGGWKVRLRPLGN